MIAAGNPVSPITCTASAQAMGAFFGYMPPEATQFVASSFYQQANNIPSLLIKGFHQSAYNHKSIFASMHQDAPSTSSSPDYMPYILGGAAVVICLSALIAIILKRDAIEQALINLSSRSDKEVGGGLKAVTALMNRNRFEWGDMIPDPALSPDDPNVLNSKLVTTDREAHPIIPFILTEAESKASANRLQTANVIARIIAEIVQCNLDALGNVPANSILWNRPALLQMALQEVSITSRYIHGTVESETGPGRAWVEVNMRREDPFSFVIDLTGDHMGIVGKETVKTSLGERVHYELGGTHYYINSQIFNIVRPAHTTGEKAFQRLAENNSYFTEMYVDPIARVEQEYQEHLLTKRATRRLSPRSTIGVWAQKLLPKGVLPGDKKDKD